MLIWTSFIGQFVQGGRGLGKELMGDMVIFASFEYYFIRVHENLMQHPSNNISIGRYNIDSLTPLKLYNETRMTTSIRSKAHKNV